MTREVLHSRLRPVLRAVVPLGQDFFELVLERIGAPLAHSAEDFGVEELVYPATALRRICDVGWSQERLLRRSAKRQLDLVDRRKGNWSPIGEQQSACTKVCVCVRHVVGVNQHGDAAVWRSTDDLIVVHAQPLPRAGLLGNTVPILAAGRTDRIGRLPICLDSQELPATVRNRSFWCAASSNGCVGCIRAQGRGHRRCVCRPGFETAHRF